MTSTVLLNDSEKNELVGGDSARHPVAFADAGLVEEGHIIPIAQVQAMHEGKRPPRAKRTGAG
jgi:hypothetical protein